jgi:hypothetical protein
VAQAQQWPEQSLHVHSPLQLLAPDTVVESPARTAEEKFAHYSIVVGHARSHALSLFCARHSVNRADALLGPTLSGYDTPPFRTRSITTIISGGTDTVKVFVVRDMHPCSNANVDN